MLLNSSFVLSLKNTSYINELAQYFSRFFHAASLTNLLEKRIVVKFGLLCSKGLCIKRQI
jgi:hypothetical protein